MWINKQHTRITAIITVSLIMVIALLSITSLGADGGLGSSRASLAGFARAALDRIDSQQQSGDLTSVESAILKGALVRNPESLPDEYQTSVASPVPQTESHSPFGRCANSIMREVEEANSSATGAERTALRQLVARPSMDSAYDSPGGFFKLHYNVTGTHAVPLADTNSNNLPDYIERLGEVADSVWRLNVEHLGYLPPPSDGSAGGDSRYDIYFQQISFYGYIISGAAGDSSWNDYTSYMFMHRNFLNFPQNTDPEGSQLGSAKATLAHEFFHSLQYAYDRDDETWFMEASATWNEEIVFDATNDNYAFLPFYLNFPHLAMHTEGDHMYGAFLWPLYFSEAFDNGLMRKAWEGARYGSAMESFGDSLFGSYGVTLEDAYAGFVPWLYLTGARDVGGRFPEAGDYPTTATAASHLGFPVTDRFSARSPGGLSSAFVEFQPNGATGSLKISFDGADSRSWDAQVIARTPADVVSVLPIPLDQLRRGAVVISNIQNYSLVTLAGSNTSLNTTSASFHYSAELVSSEALTVEAVSDTIAYTLAQNHVGIRVTNQGVSTDSFTLSATNDAGWAQTILDSSSGALLPGESTLLRVALIPPTGTLPGSLSTASLIATSATNLAVRDSVVILQVIELQFGDSDWNGRFSIGDITHIINFLFLGGSAPAPEVASGDANCSGHISIGDVTALVNLIFLGGPPPPCNALDPF